MVLHDSIVLINDGSGHFPARVELPPPPFYRGYTAVEAIVSMNAARASGSIDSDINDDGYQDLVLMHTRNDDVASEPNPEEVAWTGRYVQVLVNRGDADDVSFTRRNADSPGSGTDSWHALPGRRTARERSAATEHEGLGPRRLPRAGTRECWGPDHEAVADRLP